MAKYEIKRLIRRYENDVPFIEGDKKYFITNFVTEIARTPDKTFYDYTITFRETRFNESWTPGIPFQDGDIVQTPDGPVRMRTREGLAGEKK